MARIQRLDPEVSPNVGSSFNVPDQPGKITIYPPNVPFQAKTDYMGQAIERLGGAVSSLGTSLANLADQRQATADASWFSKARAQTAVDWMEKEAALRESYAGPVSDPGAGLSSPGLGGPGFTEFAGKEFETYRDGVLKNAPSETARQQYQIWADGFGAQITPPAFLFQ